MGALPGPGRLGFALGMGAASDRMAAYRQRRTAPIGQLPMGARGSHVEPSSTPSF